MMIMIFPIPSIDRGAVKLLRLQRRHQFSNVGDEAVTKPIHQFRLKLVLREHDDRALALTSSITRFQMGASATGKDQHACVAPMQRVPVEFKTAIGWWLPDVVNVLPDRPLHPIGVDLAPRKPLNARRWIAEIVDFVS